MGVMKDRMRYVLSREDYEALYWPPDEYPMNTVAAAGELRPLGTGKLCLFFAGGVEKWMEQRFFGVGGTRTAR